MLYRFSAIDIDNGYCRLRGTPSSVVTRIAAQVPVECEGDSIVIVVGCMKGGSPPIDDRFCKHLRCIPVASPFLVFEENFAIGVLVYTRHCVSFTGPKRHWHVTVSWLID